MTSPRVRWIAERIAQAEFRDRMPMPPGEMTDRLLRDMAQRWLPVAEAIAEEIERHVRAECARACERGEAA
jgi:hypothetical protein